MTLTFPRSLRLATGAGLALLLTACATTGPQIRSNVDAATDFSRYRSFAFVEPLGTDRASYETLVSATLKQSARRELEARGLVYDQTAPDLLVNFNGKLDDKLRVRDAPGVSVGLGYYGYRGGIYGTWPLYRQTEVDQYRQGTLNVDVVDARRKQMVWEGVAVGRVTEKTERNVEAAIERVMPQIFSGFPIPRRSVAPAN
jgi:hypothetical protein